MKHSITPSSTSLQSGSAMVGLLIFIVVALSVITLSGALLTDLLSRTQRASSATQALSVAESGAENAILRLLRNPAYTGETLPVGDNQAIITVVGAGPMTVTSRGESGEYARTVTVQLNRVNGALQVTSWQESPS